MRKDLVIKAEPAYIDTNPIGSFSFFKDFLDAARASLSIATTFGVNFPALFLYARSLELAMKSVLLAFKKHKTDQLKQKSTFGHNLEKGVRLLNESNQKLVIFSKNDTNTISRLNHWYNNENGKMSEYYQLSASVPSFREQNIKNGNLPEIPDFDQLDDIAEKFLKKTVVNFIISNT